MVLSDVSILTECLHRGMITPYETAKIIHKESGMSYGLQACSYDFRCAQDVFLGPDTFWNSLKLSFGYGQSTQALVSTIEKVNMPHDVRASVDDKSSWWRQFVSVGNTHFDPGFRGTPTIEIINHSRKPIRIKAGTPICQFVFFRLDRPARVPYNGKYQDQAEGPQPWRKENGI